MLIPILLLNMLIAMMGNTYGIVIESAEKEFLKAWAKVKTKMKIYILRTVKVNMCSGNYVVGAVSDGGAGKRIH